MSCVKCSVFLRGDFALHSTEFDSNRECKSITFISSDWCEGFWTTSKARPKPDRKVCETQTWISRWFHEAAQWLLQGDILTEITFPVFAVTDCLLLTELSVDCWTKNHRNLAVEDPFRDDVIKKRAWHTQTRLMWIHVWFQFLLFYRCRCWACLFRLTLMKIIYVMYNNIYIFITQRARYRVQIWVLRVQV